MIHSLLHVLLMHGNKLDIVSVQGGMGTIAGFHLLGGGGGGGGRGEALPPLPKPSRLSRDIIMNHDYTKNKQTYKLASVGFTMLAQ